MGDVSSQCALLLLLPEVSGSYADPAQVDVNNPWAGLETGEVGQAGSHLVHLIDCMSSQGVSMPVEHTEIVIQCITVFGRYASL